MSRNPTTRKILNNLVSRKFVLSRGKHLTSRQIQCDKMARLFFNIGPFYNNSNLPKSMTIYLKWYKIWPNTNLSF